jgi:DNA-binding response OmpR family regulator
MKRILLIEDENLIADLLRRKLADEGYYVFVSGDGESGLEEIRAQKPDLVLLDIVLPRLNGFEVLRSMRKDETIRRIPVIIISNSGQQTEIEEAKHLGVADWLVKTEFDPGEVVRKVKKQIGSGDETQ